MTPASPYDPRSNPGAEAPDTSISEWVLALARQSSPAAPQALLRKLLLLDRFDELHGRIRRSRKGGNFFETLLDELNVRVDCGDGGADRIPASGPVVLVANHPFGLLEGAALGAMLGAIRKDVKFLGNSLLQAIPPLRQHLIPVDPFGGKNAARTNIGPIRESLAWLKKGGLLVVFPAGEVSSLQLKNLRIADPEWSETVARLIRVSNARTVPVYIAGDNSKLFQIAGLVHPRLRTAMIPHELFNKKGHSIRLVVGNPIEAARVTQFASDRESIDFLRRRTYLLGARQKQAKPDAPLMLRQPQPTIAPVDPAVLEREIAALPADALLASASHHRVYVASARQIPELLREIGRLREVAFRRVGEGTGRGLDLDRFDEHYLHLFVWSPNDRMVVGGYRMGRTDEILRREGSKGLYTNTLFRFDRRFLERVDPALELGRSFVHPDAQKSYVPLLLLWKGIGQYVSRNPQYRHLFGPVSISRSYRDASRLLMLSYLSRNNPAKAEQLVRSRHGWYGSPFEWIEGHRLEVNSIAPQLTGLDELDELLVEIESGNGVPVLLRQYLSLGGETLEFNIDRKFSGVLDCLVLVDLLKTEPRLLARYMGKAEAEAFRTWHLEASRPAA